MARLERLQTQSDVPMADANQDNENVVPEREKTIQINQDDASREGLNGEGAERTALKLKSKRRAEVRRDGGRWKSLLGKRKRSRKDNYTWLARPQKIQRLDERQQELETLSTPVGSSTPLRLNFDGTIPSLHQDLVTTKRPNLRLNFDFNNPSPSPVAPSQDVPEENGICEQPTDMLSTTARTETNQIAPSEVESTRRKPALATKECTANLAAAQTRHSRHGEHSNHVVDISTGQLIMTSLGVLCWPVSDSASATKECIVDSMDVETTQSRDGENGDHVVDARASQLTMTSLGVLCGPVSDSASATKECIVNSMDVETTQSRDGENSDHVVDARAGQLTMTSLGLLWAPAPPRFLPKETPPPPTYPELTALPSPSLPSTSVQIPMPSFPRGLIPQETAPVDGQGGEVAENSWGAENGEEDDRDDITTDDEMEYDLDLFNGDEKDGMHDESDRSQDNTVSQPPTANDSAATQLIPTPPATPPRHIPESLNGRTSTDIHAAMIPQSASGEFEGLRNDMAKLQAAVTSLETLFNRRSTRMEKRQQQSKKTTIENIAKVSAYFY